MANLAYCNKVNYRRWTKGSIDCYNRGCVCIGCPTQQVIQSQECKAKQAVLSLVRLYGPPPDYSWFYYDGLTERENEIVIAIVNGAATQAEVSEMLEMPVNSVKVKCTAIYRYLEEIQGYNFVSPRKKFEELVTYLRTKRSEKNGKVENASNAVITK